MGDVLAILQTVKPREKAGSHTLARYGFQVHLSILKMIEMHQAGRDYRAAFDHFDDLMVFNKSEIPTKVEFFQIKTQAGGGEWTLKQMTADGGKKPRPRSFVGKMHHHMSMFGHTVERLGFVSNLTFKLKLKSGKFSTPDHVIIRSVDLHDDVISIIKTIASRDCVSPSINDGSGLFHFESTNLPLREQEVFVRGKIGDYIASRGDAERAPVMSLYDTLLGNVLRKSSETREFVNEDDFYEHKTLCRAQLEAMFLRALTGKRFHDSWTATQQHLVGCGIEYLETVSIQNDCIEYISLRQRGEPGAVEFNTSARKLVLDRKPSFLACKTLPNIVDLLGQGTPADYENRRGGLYVEAFEAWK